LHHQQQSNKINLKTKKMKTIKFFSAICLALLFAGTSTVYSSNGLAGSSNFIGKPVITYVVIVHLEPGLSLCNKYLVQMTNEAGQLVAPSQIFNPKIGKYVFAEQSSGSGKVRTATLVLLPNVDSGSCATNLITEPDVETGPFSPGNTYSFDLYPTIK
jgi:hypothetical protein